MSVDITKAASIAQQEDDGQVIHVRDIDGELLYHGDDMDQPVTITVAGTYSTVHRAAVNRQRDRLVKMRRNKLTGEMLDDQQLELDAACILDWDGFTVNDKPVPCTRENAKTLLANVPWIREQVEEAMNDHAGFSKSSLET